MATPSQAPDPQFNLGGYAQQHSIVGVEFWPRAAARVIDTIVHLVAALIAGFFIGVMIAITATVKGANVQEAIARVQGTSVMGYVLSMLGAVVYQAVCEGLHGSSLGKLILGQVVLSVDHKPCGMRAAFVRSLAYFIDSLFFGAIGYFAMQKTDLHQRYGDEWAKTFVCKRADAPSESLRSGGRFVGVFVLAVAADMLLLTVGLLAKAF